MAEMNFCRSFWIQNCQEFEKIACISNYVIRIQENLNIIELIVQDF